MDLCGFGGNFPDLGIFRDFNWILGFGAEYPRHVSLWSFLRFSGLSGFLQGFRDYKWSLGDFVGFTGI